MIKVLDNFIADKIAAGEVIERPLSIVKELVENSVDAGATSIIVEIRNGGKTYIRVTDNGCGIPSDEVETAFLRHATGKISTLDDLNAIHTLGFRGEALASISAISRQSIVTRTPDSTTGFKLAMHGGQKVSADTVGCNIGTTMIVEDVFYNIPARRKFMGSDAREAAAIIELIQKLAIYYANIRFMMINNGKTVLSTEGDGDYKKAIMSIYPGKEFQSLIKVENDSVKGFISDPGTVKTNRKGQIFFVNGRIVESKIIEKGLMKGYGDRIFSGYPVAILFIETDPMNLDVNIHPGKKEIKFLYEDEIVNNIASAVSGAMHAEESIPSAEPVHKPISKEYAEVTARETYTQVSLKEHKAAAPIEASAVTKTSETSEASEPMVPSSSSEEKLGIREFLQNIANKPEPASPSPVPKVSQAEPVLEPEIRDEYPEVIEKRTEEVNKETLNEEIEIDGYKLKPFDFEDLTVIGYAFNSYIFTQAGEMLYILDQHAAHERIFYEKLITRYNSSDKKSQPILTPFLIETSQDVYNSEREWVTSLSRMGYAIDDFGAGTFIVREIPEYMSLKEADTFAREFIESLGDNSKGLNRIVVDKLIMRSCKAAVKANDKLSMQEINELLEKLSACKNPFSCPHGRPTFIKVSKYEIERAFKRK